MNEKYEEPLRLLRATAENLRTEHETWCSWDGRLYNVGTVDAGQSECRQLHNSTMGVYRSNL